jgi:hypothetical protein
VIAHVHARAFRGTRKKSVYRDHVIPANDLARIAEAGRKAELHLVASLASLPCELNKKDALHLAGQLSELRLGAELLDLDNHLTTLAELARFCARARGGAWLTFARWSGA